MTSPSNADHHLHGLRKHKSHFWVLLGLACLILVCLIGLAVYIRFRVKIKSKKASAFGHAVVGDEEDDEEFDELLENPVGPPRSDPKKWSDKMKTKAERRREKREQREFDKFMKMADPMMDMNMLAMMGGGPPPMNSAVSADPTLYDSETPLSMAAAAPQNASSSAPRKGVPSLNLGGLGGGGGGGGLGNFGDLERGGAGPMQQIYPDGMQGAMPATAPEPLPPPPARRLPTFGKNLDFEDMNGFAPRYHFNPGQPGEQMNQGARSTSLGGQARQRNWMGA